MTETPLANQPLFSDPDARASFPAPLAVTIEVMVSEISVSGEETTADETAGVVEALAAWLGRVWVAEYLLVASVDDAAIDDHLNRDLMEGVASDANVLTGQWIGLSRRIRAHLMGRATVVDGLTEIDFGEFGDDQHPVARLLRFRNHFSHGSFASTVVEIREHRQLLHDLLAKLPALRDQPVLCRDAETGVVRAANGRWPTVDAPEGTDIPAAHPCILGSGGDLLDLYPLLNVSFAGGEPRLEHPSKEHPVSALIELSAIAGWLETYEHQRQGFLVWDGTTAAADLPQAARGDLKEALAGARPGLVLVQGYPGCGSSGAVAAIDADDPLDLGLGRFAALGRVAVRSGDLGQSGLTVGRVLLRLAEEALGEQAGSRSSTVADLIKADGPLLQASAALAAAGKEVLLGIEDLHNGAVAYRGEPLTVRDVYEALAGTAFSVIATTVPGALLRPLFDATVRVPVVADPVLAEVTGWVDRLTRGRQLHRQVLGVLAGKGQGMHLFALCDELEQGREEPLFEPAVERALWDLQPLLQWTREEMELEEGTKEKTRLWSVFTPSLAAVLEGSA